MTISVLALNSYGWRHRTRQLPGDRAVGLAAFPRGFNGSMQHQCPGTFSHEIGIY